MFSLIRSIFRRQRDSDTVLDSPKGATGLSQTEAEELPAPPIPSFASGGGASASVIELPLKSVICCLPQKLQAQLRKPPARNAHLILPLSSVIPQLARGRVRLTFREIKAQGPPETFLSNAMHDAEQVELPLQEILSRIQPGQLHRRPGQKCLEIPEEIRSPFGLTGSLNTGIRILAPSESDRVSLSRTGPAVEPVAPPPVTPVLPVAYAPPEPQMPPPPITPLAPPAVAAPVDRLPLPEFAPVFQRVPEPSASPAPVEPPPAPIAPLTPLPFSPRQTLAAPAPAANPPLPPRTSSETLSLNLSKFMANWPTALQAFLIRSAAEDAALEIPLPEIETRLKRGKITFGWAQVRPWIVPALVADSTEHDAVEVELPLAQIAPLFMARRKGSEARSKPASLEAIPDVFAGATRRNFSENGHPAPEAALRNPAAGAGEGAPPRSLPLDGLMGAVKTAPSASSPATAVDLVSKLPGVSGALIATQDGLLVAAHLPPEMSRDTLAAFLPQMFQRLTEYTREMAMGEPSQLTFVAGGRPLTVFKIEHNFLSVLGRTGEPLPEAPLKAIAARLNQSKINS